MALFGRETEKEAQRTQRVTDWFHSIPPHGPISTALGMMAVVDIITMVLGIILGIAAIATGMQGLKHIREKHQDPETEYEAQGINEIDGASEKLVNSPTGKPWCKAGITLGIIGVIGSLTIPTIIFNYT